MQRLLVVTEVDSSLGSHSAVLGTVPAIDQPNLLDCMTITKQEADTLNELLDRVNQSPTESADPNIEQIDKAAAAMWSVYINNLRKHIASDMHAHALPEWQDAESEDRVVWKAMALRAYMEFRAMGVLEG